MRLLLALLALLLAAGSATAGAIGEGSRGEPQPARADQRGLTVPEPGVDERSGRVIDPDVRCHDNVVAAGGPDGEGRFRHEPSGPTPPPMYYAVDLEIGGCDVLLATTGEIRTLPPLPQTARVQPAQ